MPDNLLGTVDVYHTSGHGAHWGSNPVMVHAVQPRVAVMNNAHVKGGDTVTFDTLRSSPRMQDVWQIHYSSENARARDNSDDDFIANLDDASRTRRALHQILRATRRQLHGHEQP